MAPDNRIAFKPFDIYFQVEGNPKDYQLCVVNSHNFLFYEDAEKEIKHEFDWFMSKESFIYAKRIAKIIEENLHRAFKRKAEKIKYDKKELRDIIKDINQRMEIPNE